MLADDYLDLYNYAKAINDHEWQASLITALMDLKTALPEVSGIESLKQLWEQFDMINYLLLGLFSELQANDPSVDQYRLKERIWELKLERIELSKKLQRKYMQIK
ncbi:hypothetical protein [Paenibacillus sp. sgz500958]|uniref:hypothetical protein n=1 Tax=Paenibacillus sp. sgz500958 TaxID=3242475 RepID=UPI0036D40CDF